jgi:cytochrome c-type biogenesis protein
MSPFVFRRWLAAAVLAGTGSAALGCGSPPEQLRPLRPGDPVPVYGAPTLAGDTVWLAGLQGGPVMLNVWATWCPPCREEMPGLQQLHERYGGQGLSVVAVSVDSRGAEDAIERFVADFGISFTILHDPAEVVAQRFRTSGVPQTFLLDGSGRLVERWIGKFDPVSPEVTALVEGALPDATRAGRR